MPQKKAVRMTVIDGALAPKTSINFRCHRFSKMRELTPDRKKSGYSFRSELFLSAMEISSRPQRTSCCGRAPLKPPLILPQFPEKNESQISRSFVLLFGTDRAAVVTVTPLWATGYLRVVR